MTNDLLHHIHSYTLQNISWLHSSEERSFSVIFEGILADEAQECCRHSANNSGRIQPWILISVSSFYQHSGVITFPFKEELNQCLFAHQHQTPLSLMACKAGEYAA